MNGELDLYRVALAVGSNVFHPYAQFVRTYAQCGYIHIPVAIIAIAQRCACHGLIIQSPVFRSCLTGLLVVGEDHRFLALTRLGRDLQVRHFRGLRIDCQRSLFPVALASMFRYGLQTHRVRTQCCRHRSAERNRYLPCRDGRTDSHYCAVLVQQLEVIRCSVSRCECCYYFLIAEAYNLRFKRIDLRFSIYGKVRRDNISHATVARDWGHNYCIRASTQCIGVLYG